MRSHHVLPGRLLAPPVPTSGTAVDHERKVRRRQDFFVRHLLGREPRAQ
jgi:hypothetical protein